MLKKEGAMPYMDVWYRDPKNTGNMRIVAVKGSVSSIMNSEFKDKPMLPQYLTNLIEVNEDYNRRAIATVDEFHRESFDKGMTPSISEIKKGKALNRRESAWLLMLQKKAKLPVSFTTRLPSASLKKSNFHKNIKGRDFISVNVTRLNRDLSTDYDSGHFTFDVKMKLDVSIVERTFDMDMKKNKGKLAAMITEQIGEELNGLIKKIQKQQLDPISFGDYACAFRYQQWKKVENHWPNKFSRATVTVKPSVKIIEYGVVE
jgi:hypothetical protein